MRNELLRGARLSRVSPSGSGRHMSRQEVADACNTIMARLASERGGRARWAGLTARFVGTLERGEVRWPNEDYREGLQTLFGMSNAQLGLYIDRPQKRIPLPAGLTDASTAAGPPDPMRRALLGGIAAAAVAAGFLDGPESPIVHHVGASDVARLETVTDLYRSVDYEHGGGLLYLHVAGLAESATALLEGQQRQNVFHGLTAALASVRQLAGWTAFDAGLYADSQRHFLIAERIAVEGGHLALAARVRYCQARQFQHQRHNIDALHTLRYAQERLGSDGTAAVYAMLYGAQAASLAALDMRTQAIDALEQARRWFECIDQALEPAWMRFYEAGELLAQYGRVYRDLARSDSRHAPVAVDYVTQAVANFGSANVRSTALNKVGLCSAWFLAGESDQALAAGRDVLNLAPQLTSRRVLERITNIRRDIPTHQKRSDVNEFAHSLAAIAA